jgi:hypothetical protein
MVVGNLGASHPSSTILSPLTVTSSKRTPKLGVGYLPTMTAPTPTASNFPPQNHEMGLSQPPSPGLVFRL